MATEIEEGPKEEIEKTNRELLVDIIRHTTSDYNNYLELEREDADPNQYVNYKKQVPDINRSGQKLVADKAPEYADSIDPDKEMVVVITSPEARAYGTALKYLQALEAKGIEVFAGLPQKQGKNYPVDYDPEASSRYQEAGNEPIIDQRIIPHKVAGLGY